MRLQRAREQQVFLRELRESGWYIISANGFYVDEMPNFWELVIDSNYLDSIELISSGGDESRENEIDLAPLLELKNLKNLTIINNQIPDLSPLTELKNLVEIDISWCRVSSLQIQQLHDALPNCRILSVPWDDLQGLESLQRGSPSVLLEEH